MLPLVGSSPAADIAVADVALSCRAAALLYCHGRAGMLNVSPDEVEGAADRARYISVRLLPPDMAEKEVISRYEARSKGASAESGALPIRRQECFGNLRVLADALVVLTAKRARAGFLGT